MGGHFFFDEVGDLGRGSAGIDLETGGELFLGEADLGIGFDFFEGVGCVAMGLEARVQRLAIFPLPGGGHEDVLKREGGQVLL